MAHLPSLTRDEQGIATKNIVLLLAIKAIHRKDLAMSLEYTLVQTLNAHIAKPTAEFVERIARALGVPAAWILDPNMDLKSARKLRGGLKRLH